MFSPKFSLFLKKKQRSYSYPVVVKRCLLSVQGIPNCVNRHNILFLTGREEAIVTCLDLQKVLESEVHSTVQCKHNHD